MGLWGEAKVGSPRLDPSLRQPLGQEVSFLARVVYCGGYVDQAQRVNAEATRQDRVRIR
jgi:hypothetical protein